MMCAMKREYVLMLVLVLVLVNLGQRPMEHRRGSCAASGTQAPLALHHQKVCEQAYASSMCDAVLERQCPP
jgi:hypothetical protein